MPKDYLIEYKKLEKKLQEVAGVVADKTRFENGVSHHLLGRTCPHPYLVGAQVNLEGLYWSSML